MHELHSAGKWAELRAALDVLGFSGDRSKIERVRLGERRRFRCRQG